MKKSETINQLINQSVLASPPELLVRIIRSLNSNLTSSQIANIVGQDQSITAQVLRLANSSFFGFKGQISTLDKAIRILGTKMVRNIVMSSSLMSHTRNMRLWNLDLMNFWLHTFLVAEFTREFAREVNIDPDEAYIAGLLHDIGKLVLYSQKQEKTKLFQTIHTTDEILAYEKKYWDITSIDTSKLLLEKWHIPKEIIEAIVNHCRPHQSGALSKVIFFANEFSNLTTDRYHRSQVSYREYQEILAELDLAEEQFNYYAGKLPMIADKGKEMLAAFSAGKSVNRKSRTSSKVTLVTPEKNSLSKSRLELIGYHVDVVHPDEAAGQDSEDQEPDGVVEVVGTTENDHATPAKLSGLKNRLMSLLEKYKGEKMPATECCPEENEDDGDNPVPEVESVSWNFTVLFEMSDPVTLPRGRKAIRVTRDPEAHSEDCIPFFFSPTDLQSA